MKRSNCSHQQPPFAGISHYVGAVPLHMRLFQWCWLSSLLPHGKSGSLGHDGSWNLYELFFFFFSLWPLKAIGSWRAPRGGSLLLTVLRPAVSALCSSSYVMDMVGVWHSVMTLGLCKNWCLLWAGVLRCSYSTLFFFFCPIIHILDKVKRSLLQKVHIAMFYTDSIIPQVLQPLT